MMMRTKGEKLSDPIISDYPDIRDKTFQEIDTWLENKKSEKDDYAIAWYINTYLSPYITQLLTILDDNNASMIRKGWEILDKWDKK